MRNDLQVAKDSQFAAAQWAAWHHLYGLSTEQQRKLDSRSEALRGRVAKREQRVTADEVSTK